MAHAGDTVRLACPVTSDPPALTSWHKDDEAIHSGWERFRPLDRLLRIRGALPEDSGIYVCKATNGFGSVTVTHELYVLGEYITQRVLWYYGTMVLRYYGTTVPRYHGTYGTKVPMVPRYYYPKGRGGVSGTYKLTSGFMTPRVTPNGRGCYRDL